MKLKIIKTDKKYQKCIKWVDKILDKNSSKSRGKKLQIVLLLIESYENRNHNIPKPVMNILYPELLDMKTACETIFNGIERIHSEKFLTEEEEFKIVELCDKWIKGVDKHKNEVIQQLTEEVLENKIIGCE